MRSLALIPARKGSRGIPGKNMRIFRGKPLVQWAIEVAKKACDDIVVSTDWDLVAEMADVMGCDVLERPPELARDDTPMLDVCQHALAQYEHEILCLLQPTSPLRKAEDVRLAVKILWDEPGIDSVVSVSEIPAHFSPDYAMRILGTELVPYNSANPVRRQDCEKVYYRDGTVYTVRRDVVLSGSLYGDRCLPLLIPSDETVTLDTEQDWARSHTP